MIHRDKKLSGVRIVNLFMTSCQAYANVVADDKLPGICECCGREGQKGRYYRFDAFHCFQCEIAECDLSEEHQGKCKITGRTRWFPPKRVAKDEVDDGGH